MTCPNCGGYANVYGANSAGPLYECEVCGRIFAVASDPIREAVDDVLSRPHPTPGWLR